MANSAANVRVGVTGSVYVAPTSTPLPTDATTALNAAFNDTGYVGEGGVTESQGISTNKIKAWQNGDIVRVVQTEHELTYKWKWIESSSTVTGLIYPSGQITGAAKGHNAYVVQVVDGVNKVRLVIPDGQITDIGDVVYDNGEEIGWEVTITAYPDSNGVKAYRYTA
jgi:hypothetical protein